MSTDAPFTPPKKKPSVLWWLAGGFVLLAFIFLMQLFGPNPPIIVSPQTTAITSPLGPDGLPDYEQYTREMSREGVTPENNAAVLLWPPLWPGELSPKDYPAVARELGLTKIPSGSDFLERLHGKENRERVAKWLTKQAEPAATEAPPETEAESYESLVATAELADSELMDEIFDQAMSRPWTSAEVPPLAEWVAANKGPLDQLVAGSRRPRCYFPTPSHLNQENEWLIEMLLPGVQSIREAGRSLSARAMWHLGEGRIDEAWQDLLAAHRIGRLTAQGPTMVEGLVGIAIDGLARDGTLALLDRDGLTLEQARQVQRDLASLPSFSSMADSLDSMERLSYADAVIQITVRKDGRKFSDLGIGEEISYLNLVSVDWNIVLRKGNELYDRLVAAARVPDWQARAQALSQFDNDVAQLSIEIREPSTLVAGAISPGRRSEIVAGVMLGFFLPAVTAAINAEDRANAMLELERLAAALAVYRAEQGAYPEKLDDLVPAVLDKLPVDLYTTKPFIYQRSDDGYLLYSVGENGADDGGSNEQREILKGQPLDDVAGVKMTDENADQIQVPPGADDYSIRLPRPKWEMPKLPPTITP